ncbi:hypothetical protein [Chlorobium sp. N1]|uniref:hypothetical protein n=1 Tax=Chlorobium sp. N1 TaxID=2491138 RepID=UPI00103D0B94|nr:hypothetical protein [Chlorobium sp. N1]TCD47845.1 hypothetical protein E0L29_06075 [Chlorobium sp. N1]
MANISLYVSGQTEVADVTEFFQKHMLGEGEQPIAFFDGVFYESHQERVGNIAFQDYLVYSDRAVYLWARGATKDYLDRFDLSTLTVNSRNKDSAFATLNLKIRREDKEPVYVIFDMVEIHEAELITRMHTLIESVIEEKLGTGYRKAVPDAVAHRVLDAGRSVCIPRQFHVALDAPPAPQQDSSIGYGQDLLEQYKASIGYPPGEGMSGQQAPQQQPQGRPQGAGQPAGPMGGLESMLPTDPASLKRIAGSIKDLVGEAPFKLRDQVMKDLQHVPGDVATVLTAVNELVSNIAGNPHAEQFVMTAIKTAVRNDGVLGSIGKMIQMSGIGGSRKAPARQQEGSQAGRGFDDDDDRSVRRKKISVKDDASAGAANSFDFKDDDFPPPPPANDAPPAGRKKIKIQMGDEDVPALVKDMMDMDRPAEESPAASGNGEVHRRKIKITEAEGDALAAPASEAEPASEAPAPVRRKIAVKSADAEEQPLLSDDVLAAALGEKTPEKKDGGFYGTIESDPVKKAPEGPATQDS